MLLNMENVSKTYGDRTLLDGVTFYMKTGDRVGVVGVNGCGKSTFLRLAAGKERCDRGTVSYDPNGRLGYLPQDPPFDPDNTVMEQVEAGLDPTAREVARYEAVEILTRLGITFLSSEMIRLLMVSTTAVVRPMPSPFMADVVTARVGHIPSISTNVGFSLIIPL